jgi:hypothetical protein
MPKIADLEYFIEIKNLWASPESVSKNNVQLTKAQEFLTHVYCDMKSLTPSMIEALPIDSLTRHQLEQCYTAEFSTSNFSVLEDSLWTESAEFLDVALKLTQQYAQELKLIELAVVIEQLQKQINNADAAQDKIRLQALLQELESGSDTVTVTAMQNSICQEIIKLESTPIVKNLKASMETKYSNFFSRSTNQRDALILPSAGGGGGGGGGSGGGGGGGGGFDFEEVPSESEEEQDNDNNGGHRENHDADGREHHKNARMDKDAKSAAAAKEVPYVNPWVPKEHSSDEDNSEDDDWSQPSAPRKQRGRNKKPGKGPADSQGWRQAEDMTSIYIVKLPVAPKAFISGRRVSELAPGPEAEDEVRLARDYGLDGHDTGSSCAKYAV